MYLAAVHRPIAIHGSGEQQRAILHVADAVSAIVFCLANEPLTAGQTLNASAQNITVHDLARAIQDVAPGSEIRFTDQHALAHFSLAVTSERLRALGWTPTRTLPDGLNEMLQAFGPFAERRARDHRGLTARPFRVSQRPTSRRAMGHGDRWRYLPDRPGYRARTCGCRTKEVLVEANYTAIVQQRGAWWIGWIEEIPGVNAQAETREQLVDNLRSALQEALEMNRADAVAAVEGASFEKVTVSVAA